MQKMQYKCDVCEKVSDDPKFVYHAMLSVNGWYQSSQYSSYDKSGYNYSAYNKVKDYCLECLEKLGIILNPSTDQKLPEPPTIEDMIRNIVQEEIPQ